MEPSDPSRRSLWLAALHDLRQPVQAARFVLDMLVESADPVVRRRMAALLDGALSGLDGMLQTLARLARIEADPPASRPVDLSQLLADFSQWAARESITSVEVKCPRTVRVLADRTVLEEVLKGLVANAARSSGEAVAISVAMRGGRRRLTIVCPGELPTAAQREALFVEQPPRGEGTSGSFMPGLGLLGRLARASGIAIEIVAGRGEGWRILLDLEPAPQARAP